MIILWSILGLLVFAGLVFVAGYALPARWTGQAVATVPAPLERVWEVAAAVEHAPVSMRVRSVERLPDVSGLASWVEDIGQSHVTVVTESSTSPGGETAEGEPAAAFVRRLTDSEVSMSARSSVAFERAGTSTRLTSDFEIELPVGTWHVPLFRWALLFGGGAKSSARSYAKRLAKAAGVAATFE
ncbi:MAG: SRPBCC family protein [Phycisphaerales bacterium]